MLFQSDLVDGVSESSASNNPYREARTWRDYCEKRWYIPCKVGVEFLLAVVLFVFFAPIIAVTALLVRLTSQGPAFYWQTRVGLSGRKFSICKLRTMVHNCESHSGPQWSTPGDPRVTRLGRFLRATHLDEVPQLWNVLRGEMSLVGPRPERPEFVPALQHALPQYDERHLVRPGITGLAQVQLPPDTDLASVQSKLICDLYYIRRMGPWLDIRLLFSTGLVFFGVPLPWSRKVLRIPRHSEIAESSVTPSDQRSLAAQVEYA
jgi:lipopolysaccharide/colanic/teichoic acid biosynthesis glycosyltransferase